MKRKPWGWHTRYRHHKDDVPYIPDFLRWWRSRARKRGCKTVCERTGLPMWDWSDLRVGARGPCGDCPHYKTL